MTKVTQPLRDEHKELFPHVEQLRLAADSIGVVPVETTREDVTAAHAFLSRHLIPHAEAEDAALYPVVARVMGAPEAPATMRRDHVEVGRLTAELETLRDHLTTGELDAILARDLRRVLYGLYTLVGVHFAKEEEVYLPLLDERLSAEEAEALFRDMEHAAHSAMHHAAR